MEGFVYAAGLAGILVGALGLAALVTGRASGWHRLVVFPFAFALPIVETGHYLVAHKQRGEDWGRAVEFFASDRPNEGNRS